MCVEWALEVVYFLNQLYTPQVISHVLLVLQLLWFIFYQTLHRLYQAFVNIHFKFDLFMNLFTLFFNKFQELGYEFLK